MDLASAPYDVLVLIFLDLIDPDEKYATSVVSLAATCRRFHDAFYGTKLVWIEMFSAYFDLLDYHKRPDFDIQRECKDRLLALANPAVLMGNLLFRLVFENETRNLNTLSSAARFDELLGCVTKELYYVLSEEEGRFLSWKLLTVVESLASSNAQTAEKIFANTQIYEFGSIDRANSTPDWILSYEEAQVNHLCMLELLTQETGIDGNHVHVPYMSTTRHVLGMDYDKGETHKAHVAGAFASLAGEWTGHYGYGFKGNVEDAMWLTVSASEPVRPTLLGIPDSETRQLQGAGVDMIGPFVIRGWASSTGEVSFRKEYVGQHSWGYHGQILPWGIAGCWDQGPFWIWKVVH